MSADLVLTTVEHQGRGFDLWQKPDEEDKRILELDLARWAEMVNPSNVVTMITRYRLAAKDPAQEMTRAEALKAVSP